MAVKNMNKKGEFLARDFVVMLVLFSTVVGIGYLIVADMASSDTGYNNPNVTDPSFDARYNSIRNTTDMVYQMQNATASKEGLNPISVFTDSIKAGFSVIGLVFSGIEIVNLTLINFATDFGVPSVIANLIFPAIVVIVISLIVFIVVSSVSKGRL